ncbi:hypothetical protein ES703_68205 [subsurface metagenome]
MASPATHFGNNTIRIANGIAKISNNDDVNYAQIDQDGELTLAGTGRIVRHVRVAAPSWSAGAAAPTAGFFGIFPDWEFDSTTDDEVHYSLIVPYRFAAGTVIIVEVDWGYDGAPDAGTVDWALEYISVAPGEAVAGGTTTIHKLTLGNHTSGNLVRTVLDTGIVDAVAHDDLGFRLYRDVGGDSLGTDACLIQVHFQFIMDKLGKPTT